MENLWPTETNLANEAKMVGWHCLPHNQLYVAHTHPHQIITCLALAHQITANANMILADQLNSAGNHLTELF